MVVQPDQCSGKMGIAWEVAAARLTIAPPSAVKTVPLPSGQAFPTD